MTHKTRTPNALAQGHGGRERLGKKREKYLQSEGKWWREIPERARACTRKTENLGAGDTMNHKEGTLGLNGQIIVKRRAVSAHWKKKGVNHWRNMSPHKKKRGTRRHQKAPQARHRSRTSRSTEIAQKEGVT